LKKLLFIAILAIFIIPGCSKENSIVGLQDSQLTNNSSFKSAATASDGDTTSSLTASVFIKAGLGGTLEMYKQFFIKKTQASITVHLVIPAGALPCDGTVSCIANSTDGSIIFYLNGGHAVFNKNLSLDYILTGLYLVNKKVKDINFCFIDGASPVFYQTGQYLIQKKDTLSGKLSIYGVQIDHFSRYGWSTVMQ
jgi:hypothetical protein